jgi:hypothetical protein
MAASRRIICFFINIGHAIDHIFMLIFPTAVLGMQADFGRPYGGSIALLSEILTVFGLLVLLGAVFFP